MILYRSWIVYESTFILLMLYQLILREKEDFHFFHDHYKQSCGITVYTIRKLYSLLDLILKPRMVYYHNKNEILKHRKLIPNKSWSNMIYSMFNACGQTMLILRYDVFKRKMWPYGLCQNNGRFSFKTFFGSNKKFE